MHISSNNNTGYKTLFLLFAAIFISSSVAFSQNTNYWQFAPTPPMGWNSWDCFGCSVTEDEVKANADYMAQNLKQYGWEYIIVDIQWYEPKSDLNSRDPYSYPPKLDTNIDEFGRVWPVANKHPSSIDGKGFKPLSDYVHSLGLKFGVHMMRGIPKLAYERNTKIKGTDFTARDIADTSSTCPWNPDMYGVDMTKPGAQEYYNSIFELMASWDVDYVKIDDLSRPYHQSEVTAIRNAIDNCGRPMVFSTSPGATPLTAGPHVSTHANLWRISDDFWDQWRLLKDQFERLDNWSKFCDDGHYPDADMLPLGNIRARSKEGWTRFTTTEQKTMMTTWAIARSPYMMGGHMPNNDQYTLSLLTNEEIIYVNQHSKNGKQLSRNDDLIVWSANDRNSEDIFVALINAQDKSIYDTPAAAWVGPVITRKSDSKIIPFNVNLNGSGKLYLIVEDALDGFACDHADWLDMKLTDSQGNTANLTDLTWHKASTGWGDIGINKSISGNDLLVNGTKYENGIGTHSISIIEYDLPQGKYQSLSGSAALDDGGANQAQTEGASIQCFIYTTIPPTHPEFSSPIIFHFSELGISGKYKIRSLWDKADLGTFSHKFESNVKAHDSHLLRLTKVPE